MKDFMLSFTSHLVSTVVFKKSRYQDQVSGKYLQFRVGKTGSLWSWSRVIVYCKSVGMLGYQHTVLPTQTYIELKPGPKKCSGFKAPSGRCIVLFLTRDLGFVICVVYFTLLFSLIMCAGKECKSISPRTTTSYLKMTRMNLNGIQIARPQIKQTKQMNPNGSKDLQSKARAPKRSLKF